MTTSTPAPTDVDALARARERILGCRCRQLVARITRDRDAEQVAERTLNVELEHYGILKRRQATP